MLHSNCILLILFLWAYLPNFSSFHKFKAELACCQASAIYLVNCHFPFLELQCFVARDWSDQNASFWLHFIPKTFLYNSSKFHWIRDVRAELECQTVRVLVCNYFAYFHCAFSCNCAHLFFFICCSLWFSCCSWLSILCLSLALTLYQQRVCIWHLTFNYQLLIRRLRLNAQLFIN